MGPVGQTSGPMRGLGGRAESGEAEQQRGRGRGLDSRESCGRHGYGAIQLLQHTMALSLAFLCHVSGFTATNPLLSSQHNTGLCELPGAPPWPHLPLTKCLSRPGYCGRIGREHHHCHLQWELPRRLTNVRVAAENSSTNGQHSRRPTGRRKVVEHIVLFQMKEDFTDEQEKDMLDHLFSLQYRFRGILAVSLGRVIGRMPEGVTHAMFQRFPSRDLLEQYMDHPALIKVEEEFIDPYNKGQIVVDFESEVDNDIEPLFRRGDAFQQGIEHVVFVKVREGTSQAGAESMVEAFNALPQQMDPSIVVQLTAGANFSDLNKGYTHGILVRLPSEDALDTFSKHPAYVKIFTEKVLPISAGLLSADFLVDPVIKSSPL